MGVVGWFCRRVLGWVVDWFCFWVLGWDVGVLGFVVGCGWWVGFVVGCWGVYTICVDVLLPCEYRPTFGRAVASRTR